MVTGLLTVTVVEADLVGSACDVAVTVSIAPGLAMAAPGGVYSPLELRVPQGAPLQPVPEMVQVTAVLDGPVTVAVNWIGLDCEATTICNVGLIETLTGSGVTVIADCPLCVGSATDVAVRVSTIEAVEGSPAGGL